MTGRGKPVLAEDLGQANAHADEEMLRLLARARDDAVAPGVENARAPQPVRTPGERDQYTPASVGPKKPSKSRDIENWGAPTALLNTRIPPEMAELLNDLVYKLRKQGSKTTKQALAQEALVDLFQKHKLTN